MSLYKIIKEKLIFCIKNKMSDARVILIDIFNEITTKSEQRKRKLSDREIKAIVKAYINSQNQKLKKLKNDGSDKYITDKMTIDSNISIAKTVLCGFDNGNQPVPKTGARKGTGGSNPPPHAKGL